VSVTVAHILVVDDEADSRDALSRLLQRRGHRATSVPNGREALAVLTSSTPDLIVLDLRMPHMDGIMFLEVVRSYLRLQHIPVLIMTAYPESPDLSRAQSLGVRGTFTKGEGDFNKLLDAVEREAKALPGGGGVASTDVPPRVG
jgi:CheY-like chemotaxis protein